MKSSKRKYEKWIHADGTAMSTEEKAEFQRSRSREYQAEKSSSVQEIGPLPSVKDEDRKENCRFDLQLFIETYLKSMFKNLKYRWASFHEDMFQILQQLILEGGLFVEALPRGSVKTGILEAAMIWGGGYGHTPYGVTICATDRLSMDFLESYKTQWEVQPLLLADFPEVAYPIRKLDRKSQRCKSQRVNGEPTRIEWSNNHIVFPSIQGYKSSGFRLATSGLTGSKIRGLRFTQADGTEVRPSVVILDDPQTNKSAKSVKQVADRLDLIRGAVLGMAGPGEPMAVAAAVTVIQKGDVADQLLDDPSWQSMRYGIVNALPKNMDLWQQYREIQKESVAQRRGSGLESAFYLSNREKMDEGTVATWPDRFNKRTEHSGIQAAMNIYFDKKPKAFFAEYMNQPESLNTANKIQLKAEVVAKRLSGLDRGIVPFGFEKITSMCDVQKRLLWYVVMAWKDDFTGSVIDYGWFPDQPSRVFTLDELTRTLQSEAGVSDDEVDAAVSWGLKQYGEKVLDYKWRREDGAELTICRAHPDINYPESSAAVARFCRNSRWSSILTPAKGYGMKLGRAKISTWAPKPGQRHPPPHKRRDCEWMITSVKQHMLRECLFHPHHWKGRMTTAFSIPIHAPGSVTLYGKDEREHELFSQHAASHYAVEAGSDENRWTEYLLLPGVERDDLWDGVVGCAVAASIEGCELATESVELPKKKPFKMPGM